MEGGHHCSLSPETNTCSSPFICHVYFFFPYSNLSTPGCSLHLSPPKEFMMTSACKSLASKSFKRCKMCYEGGYFRHCVLNLVGELK